jgi:uncharacterized protein (TIGR03083 family)
MIRLVELLATTWTSIDGLCSSLTEDEWKRPTGCPGWSVQDNVSHLIDFEAFALGRPRPDHQVEDLANAKNDMGKINEIGVDARRRLPGADVLAEYREVTAERLAQLQELTDADLDTETMTPIGPGTLRDLLTLRVMDTWSHEQDIRRALGRPGHVAGPVVEHSVEYFSRFVPFAVAKRAGAPDGTTVVFHVGDLPPFGAVVEGGRGKPLEGLPDSSTVVVRTDPGMFEAYVGGRSDADPSAAELAGDVELGRRIVQGLGFMP